MTDLSREAARSKALDWAFARIRELETELTRYEPVTVSTSTTPHTLNIRRAGGATDWVDNGVSLYVKVEA